MFNVGLRIAGISRHAASGYLNFKTITVDHTQVSSTQTDFPVLISGTFSYLKTVANGGLVQNASGFDIILSSTTAMDGSAILPFQIESYDPTTGAINFWVKLSSLSSSVDTVIYLLYDNPAIFSSQESPSVWTNGFVSVQHLNGNSADNSGNGNNGSDTIISYATEKIAKGAVFNGTSSQISLGAGVGPDTVAAKCSFSAWVNATSWAQAYNAVESKEKTGSGRTLLVKSTGKLAIYVSDGSFTIDYDGTGTHTLSTGTWYLVSYTYDGSGTIITGYVNGVLDATVNNGNPGNLTVLDTVALELFGASFFTSRVLAGALDEIHVANVVRSANWFLTEYNNQNSPGTFYTVT